MNRSFLKQPRPVLTAIMAGQTPEELIAESRNADFDGARGIAVDLDDCGADVVKIVTTVNMGDELAEAFRTTLRLQRELNRPFIHLCSGAYSRPHRFLGPALGVSIFFAVQRYEPRYGMPQPTIRAMKAVLDNLHWNISELTAVQSVSTKCRRTCH